MEELNMTGNCLKGSRPLLSFDASFESKPYYKLIKELFIQVISFFLFVYLFIFLTLIKIIIPKKKKKRFLVLLKVIQKVNPSLITFSILR